MANPTTNYGFVLPTATDLVTDLPADFDVALQGVDTRLKALQPGTTLGDLFYASATANTNTRLGIGSTSQVLTVTSGVPVWATPASASETWTLLSTTSMNTLTTVTISSITSKKLILHLVAASTGTTGQDLIVRPNGNTTAANYLNISQQNGSSGGPNLLSRNGTVSYFDCGRTDSSATMMMWFQLNNCDSTSYKTMQTIGGSNIASGSPMAISNGFYIEAAAVTSITFTTSSGTFTAGTLKVYGAS